MTTESARAVPNARHVHDFAIPAGGITTTNLASSVYGATATSVDTTTAAGTAATVSRSDHVHDIASAAAAILSPPGAIVGYGGASAPTGWLLCDGSAVSRTTHAALFTAIGTAYGAGDGSTTFNVPDLRQRFPLGQATSGTGAVLGDTGGAIDHVHDLNTATSHAKLDTDATPRMKYARKTVASYNTNRGVGTNSEGAVGVATTLGTALGGDSDTENPPFQVVNYIIRTT